jgi:MiaB/RimO family radical SAM methylthiotransferase
MYDHSPNTYVVRVAEGCLGSCTYCATRFSRGQLRSKPANVLLSEVKKGVRSGANEILLTATDLAAYGRDIGTNLADLLEDILRLPGDFDLLLFYANPRWLMDIWDRLEPIFGSGRIHFVHLSLNGGSEAILKRMRRGYTLSDFEKFIHSLRRTSPGTVLQTQIIVGFPGETDKDFEQSRLFFKRNFFHNVQVHAFDARPGTLAGEMPCQIPIHIRDKRRKILYRQTLLHKMKFNISYFWGNIDWKR